MSTDDADPGNPSSPDDSRDGEQSQDLQPGQPGTHEPELDAYGVPVQDRPKGRAYMLIAAGFFFGGVSASLGIMKHLAKHPPHYLVAVCILSVVLTFGAVGLLGREDRRSDGQLQKQRGWVRSTLETAAIILAIVGLVGLAWGGNCGDNCVGDSPF